MAQRNVVSADETKFDRRSMRAKNVAMDADDHRARIAHQTQARQCCHWAVVVAVAGPPDRANADVARFHGTREHVYVLGKLHRAPEIMVASCNEDGKREFLEFSTYKVGGFLSMFASEHVPSKNKCVDCGRACKVHQMPKDLSLSSIPLMSVVHTCRRRPVVAVPVPIARLSTAIRTVEVRIEVQV